jgi:colanic acid biosynthesis glycosyl transferase WcaI
MRNKTILIHSLVFSPDRVSTAYIYNDIALGFKSANYDVIVLTTTPHFNKIPNSFEDQPLQKKYFGLYKQSDFHGIKVIHVPLKKYKSTKLRLLSFIYWHITSLILGLSIKKIDYILSPSPPLSIGFISIIIAKIKRAKTIYNVQEVYPDLLIKLGHLKSKTLINLLKILEKYIYNNSTAITTIDDLFLNQIAKRVNNPEKIKIISNFVDLELYKPLNKGVTLPETFFVDPKISRVLYAGNIGHYQDWEPILFAANKLKGNNIEFWIIGEGVKKEYLQNEIMSRDLKNIKLFPYQDRKLIPLINSVCDIHFISNSEELGQEGFPSKVYTIMACAKPLIVVTGKKTPLYNFLHDLDCSILISNNRNNNFLEAINFLHNHKEVGRQLGKNGYNKIIEDYSKDTIVQKYLDLVASL